MPDGRLLMHDGSISAKGTDASAHAHAHTLHKPDQQQPKGMINNMSKMVKDAA